MITSQSKVNLMTALKNRINNGNRAFVVAIMCVSCSTQAFAAEDMRTKAKSIMSDVYNKILGISTIAAVVTACVALLPHEFFQKRQNLDNLHQRENGILLLPN